ncbi:putative protein [Arabidopsis thaliana]|uniref:Uncharacterized protein AT4g09040 n=1 Tax=Arabidopsis thaliana TaxID=3702 RepID=Q9M0S3_ARATH|nr:putative protein [Arabidopsis thaliana]
MEQNFLLLSLIDFVVFRSMLSFGCVCLILFAFMLEDVVVVVHQSYHTLVEVVVLLGLVFIEMASPEEASTAFISLESYEYEGRRLKVDYAKTKKKKTYAPRETPSPVPTFNLFVANLAFEARAKHLKEFFDADTGNVVSTEVIFHENPRRSSGYGFVSFKTKKQAEAALIEFQGKDFLGRPIRLAKSKQFVKLQAKEGLQPPEEEAEEEPSQSETMTQEHETPAA